MKETPRERRHGLLEEAGRASVRGWIGHPAVRQEVDAAKLTLVELAAPLLGFAGPAGGTDQGYLTLVVLRLIEGAIDRPDGELPNPLAGAAPALLESAATIGPELIRGLRAVARRLADAGAALDPEDDGVVVVLAQLVLLEFDLDRPAAAIEDDLNVLSPGWIDREAAQVGAIATHASRHASARTRMHLDAAAAELAAKSGLGHIPAPYAGGGARQAPARTEKLRALLRTMLERDPSLTPTVLLALAEGQDHPGLKELRETLGWDPDQRTLERNWPKITALKVSTRSLT